MVSKFVKHIQVGWVFAGSRYVHLNLELARPDPNTIPTHKNRKKNLSNIPICIIPLFVPFNNLKKKKILKLPPNYLFQPLDQNGSHEIQKGPADQRHKKYFNPTPPERTPWREFFKIVPIF